MFITAHQVAGLTLWGQFEVNCMTNSRALPDTTVGTGEPAASRIVLTLFFVGLLGLYSSSQTCSVGTTSRCSVNWFPWCRTSVEVASGTT